VKKVVVTGMGCVSGLGADRASTWTNLISGVTAIRQTRTAAGGQTEIGIECPTAPVVTEALDALRGEFEEKQLAAVEPFSNFGAAATLEALKDAGLRNERQRLAGAAIIYGSASGGNATIEAAYTRAFLQRLPTIHPMSIPRYMTSASVSHLSMLFGIRGHCLAVSSACATSAHAISEAMYFIRSGRGPLVICGGSDASLTFGSLLGWKSLQAMAPDTCRPFSADRKGMVVGEGAATFVLEDEEHARQRGARIYAEISGAASSADARHITQPDAENAAATIAAAMAEAGVEADEPILYSAHGTGTKLNDRSEATALKLAFPGRLDRVRVIATKAAHGHMLGATGAMELLVAIQALIEKMAPPIVNYLGPDPECDVPLVLSPEPIDARVTVSSSFAFGGLNSVLVARKY
jgi:nodulation protein E